MLSASPLSPKWKSGERGLNFQNTGDIEMSVCLSDTGIPSIPMAVVLHDNDNDKMMIQRMIVYDYNSTNTPSIIMNVLNNNDNTIKYIYYVYVYIYIYIYIYIYVYMC